MDFNPIFCPFMLLMPNETLGESHQIIQLIGKVLEYQIISFTYDA